jgi:hypothetical protein
MPLFERLKKPFLTVETGEAYQPIRLTYNVTDKENLLKTFNQLACLESKTATQTWNWFWRGESEELHFESLSSYQKNPEHPLRLGTLSLTDDQLFINLPSFKRACIALHFFHPLIETNAAQILKADFINKVFGIDERLPHGFSELFKEEELDSIVKQRIQEEKLIEMQVEQATSAEEALSLIAEYTQKEAQKRLPYAERYLFQTTEAEHSDPEIIYLGFYIFLRGRELVAIRRWFGETGYTLSDAADETIKQVFGDVPLDFMG